MSIETTSVQSQSCISQYHNWLWDKNRWTGTQIFLLIPSLLLFYPILGLASLAGRACRSKDETTQKVDNVASPLLGTSDQYLAKPLFVTPDLGALKSARESGKALREVIDKLRWGKGEGWQQEAMKLIIAARLSNPHEEQQRLIGTGIIDESYGLNGVGIEVAILMAQALEIQNVFGDTHYVFLHGQPSTCAYLSYLLKEAAKRQNPESDFSQFEVLRTLKKREGSIEEYSTSSSMVGDTSPKAREQLLSVDASFFSGESYESALHFVKQNARSGRILEPVALGALKSAFPKATDEQLRACVREVQNNMPQNSPCGNLFVACIPKEQVPKEQASKVLYRSHPYGFPCRCFKKDPIDNLQKGEGIKCGSPRRTPQYRLFMPEVRPGENQHIYMLTPQGESNRKRLEASTSAAVDKHLL